MTSINSNLPRVNCSRTSCRGDTPMGHHPLASAIQFGVPLVLSEVLHNNGDTSPHSYRSLHTVMQNVSVIQPGEGTAVGLTFWSSAPPSVTGGQIDGSGLGFLLLPGFIVPCDTFFRFRNVLFRGGR